MVNVDMLKSCIERRNMTVGTVAEAIGIDRATFYRKLTRTDSSFSVEQAKQISDLLNMDGTEFNAIFFA